MNVENDIKVSICVVTYNQEKYIAECLESLVQQVTNFRFEIIVGEDCSTDSTRSIVQTYVEKYPNLIVALFHKDNVGGVENIKQVYKKAKGKYIAHMDGDDTALPTKLQKQFDILEQYKDCNICSHDMIRIDAEGLNKKNDWVYPEKIYSLFDLYHKLPFFAHSSKMFRNKYKDLYWDNLLSENYILDIDVHIENARDGHIYHIGEVLGAYRVGVGISIHSKKVNKALGLGAKRVFEKGLVIFSDQPDQLAQIKRLYAYALLQCAYNYAVYEQNEKLFNEYVNLSFELKFIGVKQVVFKLATFSPRLAFKLFILRSHLRNR